MCLPNQLDLAKVVANIPDELDADNIIVMDILENSCDDVFVVPESVVLHENLAKNIDTASIINMVISTDETE